MVDSGNEYGDGGSRGGGRRVVGVLAEELGVPRMLTKLARERGKAMEERRVATGGLRCG